MSCQTRNFESVKMASHKIEEEGHNDLHRNKVMTRRFNHDSILLLLAIT